ncbi:MAG: class I SAM-dependent methyltransferase [Arcobacter sp.]|uniref:class I SAM-dependent methyltransferase n=1 Tax=uncultured Arcobacter sp. TaxID=165434 RepID=UPI000CB41121|nr:class I SAM-dependent methyltransferase [uncultured Arcobacter sp.]PLY09873.1 MAG: class I SAM-dependent methyltransferase [Arcobacter sp.]
MLIKAQYSEGADRNEMIRFITNSPKTSLEVGCREAKHSKLLKETFPSLKETWGIEPDNNEILIKQAETNLDYFINDYLTTDTPGLSKKYFDLIVFNDVLEHMYDPWEVLIMTKELLTENGIIVVSLPNIRHRSVLIDLIFKDKFEYKDQGILDVTHIRFFTETTMKKLLADCGYEVLKIENTVDYKNKPLKRVLKKIRYLITPKVFRSINIWQFGITAKVK